MTIEERISEYQRLYKHFGKEDRLHIEAVTFLFTHYPLATWFHCPNEGKRTWFEQIKCKLMGVRAGVPDFVFLEPNAYYYGLLLEAKVDYDKGKNYLSKAQKIWRDKLIKKGFKFEVFRTLDEFKTLIKDYFDSVPY